MTNAHRPNPPRRPEDTDALAAGYVLGTLSAATRAAVRERLTGDEALRDAVAFWEQRLQPLADTVAPVEPSPVLWSRIEAALPAPPPPARSRPAVPSPKPWAAWWGSVALWRGAALAGFAAATFLAVAPSVGVRAPAAQFVVVLVAPNQTAPGWVVQASDRQRALRLVPLADTPVPEQRSLQFWTKADGWDAPLSLGLVQPGQPLEVPLDRLPPLQPNQLFEITLEPYNGSPTGRPTGPILYIGRSVQVL